jgi:hypothetical protein
MSQAGRPAPAGQTPKQTPNKWQKSGILVPARDPGAAPAAEFSGKQANSNGGFPRLSVPFHPAARSPGARCANADAYQSGSCPSFVKIGKLSTENFVGWVACDVIRCYIISRNKHRS